MFQDRIRAAVFQRLRHHDTRVFSQYLSPEVFARLARDTGHTLGDNPLNLANMVWLGLASAWHATRSFADVLGLTLKLLRDAGLWADATPDPAHPTPTRSKHDPRGGDPNQVSEEAFAKARKLMPWSYWAALVMILAKDFETQYPNSVRFKGFRLMSLDGTCIDLDDWTPLSELLRHGQKRHLAGRTQARMVMLLFPLVRFPSGMN